MKHNFSETQLAEISAIQEKHNLSRKAAVQRFTRSGKKISLTAGTGSTKADGKGPVVPDFKAQAANDSTNLPVVTAPAATTPEAPKTPTPSTPAGDARKEGIRLFQLAGKPKKEDFIHVYGSMGARWTWPARAKAVGLTSGEEAAKQFQAMRAKPAGSCVVVKEEPKEEPKAQK